MKMGVVDPGRDEIQITEPRRPKEKCFPQKITSSFPHRHSFPHDFKADKVSLMDLKVDIVYLMDFQMRVENTGEDEIQTREPRLPKDKFFSHNIFFNFSSWTFKYIKDAWDEIQITEPRHPKGLQCEQFA